MSTAKNTTFACAALLWMACAEQEPPTGSIAPSQPGVTETPNEGGSAPEEGGSAPNTEGAGGGPVEPACAVDAAFRATGASFTEPTHPELAMRMNEHAYGYDAAPITIVLRPTAESPVVSASASTENDAFQHVFVDSPDFVGAEVWDGGFRSQAPQLGGTLRLIDTDDIALTNLSFDVKTTADCGQLWVILDAVVPVSQGEIKIGGTKIETIAGEVSDGWQLRAIFVAESVSFDFASL